MRKNSPESVDLARPILQESVMRSVIYYDVGVQNYSDEVWNHKKNRDLLPRNFAKNKYSITFCLLVLYLETFNKQLNLFLFINNIRK